MELSYPYNPYDFANPVNDPEIFAGRKEELQDIQYYLNHSRYAPRAMSLAVIGERASGKTSLLNIIEIEANNLGFLTVRIDLDEGDSTNELSFFYKIFDNLITTACDTGLYGGINGKTYETYRDMVDSLVIPSERTFCPFIFPIQYAGATSGGNTSTQISDSNFKRDLQSIQKEFGRPIALIFDEGDVLTASRTHLQKLRNIFMNISGFMLVISGTPSLFPVINDVFSPIIRQFKKINVNPFTDEEDTRSCIVRPLQKAGFDNHNDIIDTETYHDLSELHNLTGGKPYEIQLICHFLFKKVQEKRADKMRLTVNVLDDVLQELQALQNLQSRPITNTIKTFSKEQMQALGILCSCNGHINFEQAWFLHTVFDRPNASEHEVPVFTKSELEKNLNSLISSNVLKLEEGKIRFCGDEFDSIYSKYFARTLDVFLYIRDVPFDASMSIQMDSLCMTYLKIRPISFRYSETESSDIASIASVFRSGDHRDDPFKISEESAENFYWANIELRDVGNVGIVTFSLESPWANIKRHYFTHNFRKKTLSQSDQIVEQVKPIQEELQSLSSRLDVQITDVPTVPVQLAIEKLIASTNSSAKVDILSRHLSNMVTSYFDGNKNLESFFHADAAYQLLKSGVKCSLSEKSNLSFILLLQNRLKECHELLSQITEGGLNSKTAISYYNLGILEAQNRNYRRALDLIGQVGASTETAKDHDSCVLLVPNIQDGETDLVYDVDPEISLKGASMRSLIVLNRFIEDLS